MSEVPCAPFFPSAEKVYYVDRGQDEKASVLAISNPGNWLFLSSRQYGAKTEELRGFSDRYFI
jgi:hypothetical protein